MVISNQTLLYKLSYQEIIANPLLIGVQRQFSKGSSMNHLKIHSTTLYTVFLES